MYVTFLVVGFIYLFLGVYRKYLVASLYAFYVFLVSILLRVIGFDDTVVKSSYIPTGIGELAYSIALFSAAGWILGCIVRLFHRPKSVYEKISDNSGADYPKPYTYFRKTISIASFVLLVIFLGLGIWYTFKVMFGFIFGIPLLVLAAIQWYIFQELRQHHITNKARIFAICFVVLQLYCYFLGTYIILQGQSGSGILIGGKKLY